LPQTIAGNSEAVEDGLTGYIVPTANISALSKEDKGLVANNGKEDNNGASGKKKGRRSFYIQKNVKSIQKVYLDILARRDER